MSAQDKFKKFTDTIKSKTEEYAPIIKEKAKEYVPIIKEKSTMAYEKTKEFTNQVVIPSLKKSFEFTKKKVQDYQETQKKAGTTSPEGMQGTSQKTSTTPGTTPTSPSSSASDKESK